MSVVISDKGLSAFYHTNSGVVRRVFDGRWGDPLVVSPACSDDFFITSDGGETRLLTRENGGGGGGGGGGGFFLRVEGDSWRGERVFDADGVTDLSFIRRGKDFRFLGVSGDFLVTKVGDAPFERVGRVSGGYRLQTVSPGHGLAFFGAYMPEFTLGYREFNVGEVGGFRAIYTVGAAWSLGDRAFLTTDEAVHALFVLKGLFTKRLIYRKKNSNGLGSPIMIRESPRIDKCSLYLSKGRLHATFTENMVAYEAVSTDNGEGFSAPAVYPRKFSPYTAKAALILTGERAKAADFFARDIFTDAACPWDLLQLPEVWEGFYPSFCHAKAAADLATEAPAPDLKKEDAATDLYDPFAGMGF